MLKDAGLKARLAGNIGTPLVSFVDRSRDDHVYVTEISSFQLAYTERFTPAVAVLLNVSENHLDWHGTFEDYFGAKKKLVLRQGPGDAAVLNRDDRLVWGLAAEAAAAVQGFSRKRRLARGAFVEDGWVVVRGDRTERIAPVSRLPLPGAHNLENVLAAALVGRLLGVPAPSLRRSILSFRGLEHRLEDAGRAGGVRFVNDSKATTVAATLKALASFDRPVVLILGGRGKGGDFSPLRKEVAKRGPVGRPGRRSGRSDRDRARRRRARRPGLGLPRGRPDGLRPGRARRRRPAGPGLHELGHVPGFRGARPDLQAGGPPPRRGPAEEGSPEMSVRRRFDFDVQLLAVTLVLVGLGIFFVFSASSFMASQKYGQSLHFMIQQILGALAGFAVVAFLVSVKKDFFLEPRFVYGLLGLTGLLLALCLVMPSVANTNRWIVLPGFRFQPSELAKISLILFLATFIESRKDRINEKKTLAVIAAVIAAVVGLVLLEPDFGTAVLLAGLAATVLFLGGVKLRYLAAAGLVGGILFGVYLVQADYRVDRIQGFLSSEKDALGSGYQVITVQARPGFGRGRRGRSGPEHPEAQFPSVQPHRFHLRHPGRGDRPRGDHRHPRAVPLLPLAGPEDRPGGADPGLQNDRRGHHPGHRRPGPDEHVDRPRPGTGQGNSPPPPVLRPVLPRLHAGRRGHPAPHQPEEGGHREHGEDMIS